MDKMLGQGRVRAKACISKALSGGKGEEIGSFEFFFVEAEGFGGTIRTEDVSSAEGAALVLEETSSTAETVGEY